VTEESAVKRATGREREEWFTLLDEWEAAGREFGTIAEWLADVHGVNRWWAQKLIVEFEQERGLRPPGIRPDGTFEVSTSRTVAVPAPLLFDAFVDGRQRIQWLTVHRQGTVEVDGLGGAREAARRGPGGIG
jgi:hypothetical protein